jgi:hypothetical protein
MFGDGALSPPEVQGTSRLLVERCRSADGYRARSGERRRERRDQKLLAWEATLALSQAVNAVGASHCPTVPPSHYLTVPPSLPRTRSEI